MLPLASRRFSLATTCQAATRWPGWRRELTAAAAAGTGRAADPAATPAAARAAATAPAAAAGASLASSTQSTTPAPASFEIPDAVTFGGSLGGLGVNLLVAESDWSAMLTFVREVLRLPLSTVGPNFAVLRHQGADMILHRDDTYGSNLGAVAERERAGTGTRGLGVELRLYNVHPREVEARARSAGHVVLQTTATKPHGLVECYVQGPGDYVWVPSCPTPAQPKL
jgi:hypothetical protein